MANFFEKRRKELGLSQYRMAVRLDVTPGLVSLWDRGRLVPSAPIAALAKAYETSEANIERGIIEVRRAVESREAKEKAVAAK